MDISLFSAALFDFDGTLVDTELQYSIFWKEQGLKYHPEIPNFEKIIKGQTLGQIYEAHFAGMSDVQSLITEELNEFERQMKFCYIAGAKDFVQFLHRQGIKTAIVTSSNNQKMANVHRELPELEEMFDLILTADMFTRSKPDPDCFLTAAAQLGCYPEECVVFEDSIHGLQAGRAAGMKVIALSTTHASERIAPLADEVWPNFSHTLWNNGLFEK